MRVDAVVGVQVVGRAGGGGQRRAAADVVGVPVGVEHQLDLPAALPGQVEIVVDVPERVDHHRAVAAGDDVAQTAARRSADLQDGQLFGLDHRPDGVVVSPGGGAAGQVERLELEAPQRLGDVLGSVALGADRQDRRVARQLLRPALLQERRERVHHVVELIDLEHLVVRHVDGRQRPAPLELPAFELILVADVEDEELLACLESIVQRFDPPLGPGFCIRHL